MDPFGKNKLIHSATAIAGAILITIVAIIGGGVAFAADTSQDTSASKKCEDCSCNQWLPKCLHSFADWFKNDYPGIVLGGDVSDKPLMDENGMIKIMASLRLNKDNMVNWDGQGSLGGTIIIGGKQFQIVLSAAIPNSGLVSTTTQPAGTFDKGYYDSLKKLADTQIKSAKNLFNSGASEQNQAIMVIANGLLTAASMNYESIQEAANPNEFGLFDKQTKDWVGPINPDNINNGSLIKTSETTFSTVKQIQDAVAKAIQNKLVTYHSYDTMDPNAVTPQECAQYSSELSKALNSLGLDSYVAATSQENHKGHALTAVQTGTANYQFKDKTTGQIFANIIVPQYVFLEPQFVNEALLTPQIPYTAEPVGITSNAALEDSTVTGSLGQQLKTNDHAFTSKITKVSLYKEGQYTIYPYGVGTATGETNDGSNVIQASGQSPDIIVFDPSAYPPMVCTGLPASADSAAVAAASLCQQ